jgi:hypothetical protein
MMEIVVQGLYLCAVFRWPWGILHDEHHLTMKRLNRTAIRLASGACIERQVLSG